MLNKYFLVHFVLPDEYVFKDDVVDSHEGVDDGKSEKESQSAADRADEFAQPDPFCPNVSFHQGLGEPYVASARHVVVAAPHPGVGVLAVLVNERARLSLPASLCNSSIVVCTTYSIEKSVEYKLPTFGKKKSFRLFLSGLPDGTTNYMLFLKPFPF